MFDMEMQFGEFLREAAILTAVASALTNPLAQGGVHQAAFG
jgi:hypothetical protein